MANECGVRFELDRVTELLGSDLWERYPLDDRLPSGDGDDRTGSADAGLLDAFLDRVGHDLGFANGPLGDDVRGSGTIAKDFSARPPLLCTSSTSLTALVPMSSPNVAGFLPSPNSAIFAPGLLLTLTPLLRSVINCQPVHCGREVPIVVTVYNGAQFKPSTLLARHHAFWRSSDPDLWGIRTEFEPCPRIDR